MENGKFYLKGRVEHGILLFWIHHYIVNLISEGVVKKLRCEVSDHPQSYKIIYNSEVYFVTKQTKVSFSIGNEIKDYIECHFTNIDDCHIC